MLQYKPWVPGYNTAKSLEILGWEETGSLAHETGFEYTEVAVICIAEKYCCFCWWWWLKWLWKKASPCSIQAFGELKVIENLGTQDKNFESLALHKFLMWKSNILNNSSGNFIVITI